MNRIKCFFRGHDWEREWLTDYRAEYTTESWDDGTKTEHNRPAGPYRDTCLRCGQVRSGSSLNMLLPGRSTTDLTIVLHLIPEEGGKEEP